MLGPPLCGCLGETVGRQWRCGAAGVGMTVGVIQ